MKINSTTFDVGRLLQFIIPSALFRLLVSLMHISTCSFGFPNRSVFIVAVLAFNSLKLIDWLHLVKHFHLLNDITARIVKVFLRFCIANYSLTVYLRLSNVDLFDWVEFTHFNLVLMSWCSSTNRPAAMLGEFSSEFLERKKLFFLGTVIWIDIISIGLFKGFFVNLWELPFQYRRFRLNYLGS